MSELSTSRSFFANCLVAIVLYSIPLCSQAATKRVFFIGIDSVLWDYYPPFASDRSLNSGPGGNLCFNNAFPQDQLLFVGNGSSWGSFTPTSLYEKLRFRAYTDYSFSALVNRSDDEKHLGILGPLLRVEARDTVIVYVRGVSSKLPGAVPYGFSIDGLQVVGDRQTVSPGEVKRFVFYVPAYARSKGYVSSRLLLYHGVKDAGINGGVDGGAGMYEGLVGPLVLYQSGSLDKRNKPKDIHTELVTILWIVNENNGDETEDEEESNLKHGINGQIFCSLEDLEMVQGRTTRWYFAGVGNEVDVHVAHFHGIVGTTNDGVRTDSIRLLPGSTSAVDVIPDNVGKWLFHCHINDHLSAGMSALFNVKSDQNNSFLPSPTPIPRKRIYYIQAEDVLWDYAPKGWNACDNTNYGPDELIFVQQGIPVSSDDGSTLGYTIGSKYWKSRYIEYTDDTFTTRVERSEEDAHLGVMGPVLRARVGDEIVVHFRNNVSYPTSMHPHGVLYKKDSEGSPYNDGTSAEMKKDDSVPPGASHTYLWAVPDRAGPGPGERPNAKMWIYHGHRMEIKDTYAGLFGVIVIVGRDAPYDEETLRSSDGVREVFVHMSVMNELESLHIRKNIKSVSANQNLSESDTEALLENETFEESNLMHSINGYLYCNGPVFKIPLHQPTRFHFYSLGTEVDVHTPSVGSEIIKFDFKSSRGTGALLPGFFTSSTVRPQNYGLSEIRCNVNDHYIAGMRALLFVHGNAKNDAKSSSALVKHFIAAEEVDWDYAPLGKDGCTGSDFNEDQEVFTKAKYYQPGSRYVKAVYREYEDEKFLKKKDADTKLTGVAGPLLHFEAGETVEIVFRNMASFACNIHFVGFELIGATLDTMGISSGAQMTYLFRAPKYTSTSAHDLSSVAYVYYSSVDPVAHTAAGLVGVAAITKSGMMDHSRRMPMDCSRTIPWLMNIFHEDQSPLLSESVEKFGKMGGKLNPKILEGLMEDDDWLEGNTIHSVNGYLYSSVLKTFEFNRRETVRFYVFGFGSESSMHGPAWYGQTVKGRALLGNSGSGVQIFPFNAETVDVVMSSTGLWPFVCEVSDHVNGGMKMCFSVK